MKAGLTCTVDQNCADECDNSNPLDNGMFTCTLLEGQNPDGVVTSDGSQTACPDIIPNLDGLTVRSPNPCELFAAEQRAAAEAALAKLEGEKTCIEEANCLSDCVREENQYEYDGVTLNTRYGDFSCALRNGDQLKDLLPEKFGAFSGVTVAKATSCTDTTADGRSYEVCTTAKQRYATYLAEVEAGNIFFSHG